MRSADEGKEGKEERAKKRKRYLLVVIGKDKAAIVSFGKIIIRLGRANCMEDVAIIIATNGLNQNTNPVRDDSQGVSKARIRGTSLLRRKADPSAVIVS